MYDVYSKKVLCSDVKLKLNMFLIIFCHALNKYFDVLTNIRKHMYLIIILAVMLFHITFKVNILIHQIANSSLQMCNNYKCI